MSSNLACRCSRSLQTAAEIALTGLWAVVLGLVSGVACIALRLVFRMMQWIFVQHSGSLPAAAAMLTPGRRFATPIAGALCATGVLWVVRRWPTKGCFEEYVEAVRFQDGNIPFASTLWRTVSSVFSVATGAAIGREGSMIQFAAAVTSWVGKRSGIRTPSLSHQVSYGVAAAISAAYSAPIAGVFFAFEIVLGEWSWPDVLPLTLSSIAGWFVSRMLLGAGPLFAVHEVLGVTREAAWGFVLALVMGLVAPLYHKLMQGLRFASRWPLALVWAAALGGILSLLRPEVWGNGDVALLEIVKGFSSLSAVVVMLALRLTATTLCVGTGTVGGVFTPTLFVGAALGLVSGQLLHAHQPVMFAIIGMATFLSAVTHAPFMATLMAVELTGLWHLLPLLLLYNLLAWKVAQLLSSRSLYAIATPDPNEIMEMHHVPA